jgi:choline dehydrogenase-like flavoprotein
VLARSASVQEFDYVVMGGGTAELVVAARLSEDERVRVDVFEAGGYVAPGEDPGIDLVVNYGLVPGDPKYDWNLKNVSQEGVGGRVVQETVYVVTCLLTHFFCLFVSLFDLDRFTRLGVAWAFEYDQRRALAAPFSGEIRRLGNRARVL